MGDEVLRLVTNPVDDAIRQFAELQSRTFAVPEMLPSAQGLARMVASHSQHRRDYLLVAEREGSVVGGTIFAYFPLTGVGFSFYLVVAPECRRHGLARRLHDARVAALRSWAGPLYKGLLADMAAPDGLSPEAIQRERQASIDPWQRRRAFQRLGFHQVGVTYSIPGDAPDDPPEHGYDLVFCPSEPVGEVEAVPVAETLRVIWEPWLGRKRARALVRAMINGRERLPLEALAPHTEKFLHPHRTFPSSASYLFMDE